VIEIIIDGFAQAMRAPQGVIVPPLPPAFRKHHSVRMYTPAEVKTWQTTARVLAAQKMKGLNPLKGMLVVQIQVYLPPPASMSKKKLTLALRGQLRPTTRPDCDNYAKITLDALNQIVWLDDSQIVTLVITKWYAEKPRVEVMVNEIPYPTSPLAEVEESGELFK
jgi:Holliday junction resolvase RusA-like endonuclease